MSLELTHYATVSSSRFFHADCLDVFAALPATTVVGESAECRKATQLRMERPL
jgi:hypothetical protein